MVGGADRLVSCNQNCGSIWLVFISHPASVAHTHHHWPNGGKMLQYLAACMFYQPLKQGTKYHLEVPRSWSGQLSSQVKADGEF